jgi:hypothetical protein
MNGDPGGLYGIEARSKKWGSSLLRGAAGLALASAGSSLAMAQQSTSAPVPVVFDGVNVVDVETGKLVPDQRVVIEGTRIKTVGTSGSVAVPKGATVVPAKDKYLVPGFWDMHVHPGIVALAALDNPVDLPNEDELTLFIIHGVTGFRDAWSQIPLDTLTRWRSEILAGTRVGPPRQLLSGVAVNSGESSSWDPDNLTGHVTVTSGDSADVNKLLDALKKKGATWVKTYNLDPQTYYLVARAARQRGMRFGGHESAVSPLDAADSGASTLDHVGPEHVGDLDAMCFNADEATVEACKKVADKFKQTNTWHMPTLSSRGIRWFREGSPKFITNMMMDAMNKFWTDYKYNPTWLAGHETLPIPAKPTDTLSNGPFGYLKIASEVGLPTLSGGDTGWPDAGFKTHADMAILVDRGMTPLQALQAATLNPAKAIQGTDSLGTVAAGKLADLVLLDANPLADITNTTQIRAVVANGRYFDRAALDGLIAQVKSRVK